MPDDRVNPNDGVDLGEYVSLPDEGTDQPQVTDAPDGGIYATLGDEAETIDPVDAEFYANLAPLIPSTLLDPIITDLIKKIEDDIEARTKRDEQQEEGLKRTGLGKDAPGGAEFDGASRVVHPMMTEACVDYASRVIKELWPMGSQEVVKPMIMGAPDKKKIERARRIAQHMNYQITVQIKEAKSVLETLFSQVPLGGSQFVYQVWDHRWKRPMWSFVPIDNIALPAAAADFASAKRRTFFEDITDVELRGRIDSALYIDVDLGKPTLPPDDTKSAKANLKIEGKEDTAENIDGVRRVYTTMSYVEVSAEVAELLGGRPGTEVEGEMYPYLFSIDKESKKCLAIYRDWEIEDETREPIEHLFEFPFIPWRGAYAIGLPQIIGGLSAAATGALRALLDSAHVNNALSGFIMKGASVGGQSVSPAIGQLAEIDCGLEAGSIRDKILMGEFNPPSAVLFQLLGFVVQAAQGVVRTSMDETTTDTNTNVPVGTQLSRVEQGMQVFCTCFGRAHSAFNRLLGGLYRLNRLYLPDDGLKLDAEGREILVRKSDYAGVPCVKPTADPTIYSDQQRFAQISAVQQRSAALKQLSPGAPPLYNDYEVEKTFLQWTKIPDYERLLNKIPQPTETDAVNENLLMATGQPVQVFPHQNHLAHLSTLVDFMKTLGMNPALAPIYLPAAIKHAGQHLLYLYVTETRRLADEALGQDQKMFASTDDSVKAQMDTLLATASAQTLPDVAQALQAIMPVLQAAMQQVQASQPKPPMDPTVAAIQAAQAETARKAAADKTGAALNQAKQQTDAQLAAAELRLKQEQTEIDRLKAILDDQTRNRDTAADNQTALDIAGMKMGDGADPGNFTTGGSLTRQ